MGIVELRGIDARMSIGWIMFWKALILTLWSEFQEFRKKRKDRGVDPSLVAAFKEEWDRRRAKQPLALPSPDSVSDRL